MENPYTILGVDKSASEADLKAAYRKLAMKHHPDRNPGNAEAEKKFKEISAAYDMLKDPQKRAAFDRYGPQAFQQGGAGGGSGGFGPGGPGAGPGDFEFSGNFEDLFEDILGNVFGAGGGRQAQGGRRSARQKGADLRYNLEVTLAQAATGTSTSIRFSMAQQCATCHGSGAKKGTKPKTCGTCGGAGTVHMRQGFFSLSRTCPDCHGTGEIIAEKCADCHGSGRITKPKTLTVTVPPGVDHGTRLRLPGEGEAGTHGGPAGDLFVFIHLKPHPLYKRDGTDLHAEIPLSLLDAVLGTELELPTVTGEKHTVKVAAGTQPGSSQRLPGQGMPELGRPHKKGDLVVHYQVTVPTRLNKKQRELFEELAATNLPHDPKQESFLSRLKDLFTA